tara:strand:+ start:5561 stop:6670 length:1110 start_codon:yes stop_codon:yes gene_type:complete
MPLINKITKLLKTPKIFVFTIIWMMILVTIGTLAQKDMGLFAAQEKYFSSWIFWAWYFPFPGGRPTMIIMLINLSFFLFNKNLWKISKSGILIIHLGGFLLLFGGGLTAIFSSEGNIVIEEGKTSNFIEDYHYMELAIVKVSDKDFDTFTIFDHPLLKRKQILTHENFNFEIKIINFLKNCEPIRRSGPAEVYYRGMMKNFMLSELAPLKEENMNRPGIMFHIENSGTNADGVYGLFWGQSIPQKIQINNEEYMFVLRKKRTYLPFAIELLDFKKVMHPGTGIAKSYSSSVNLIEDGIAKRILIKMNTPLRHNSYTFYQSSFIEGPEGDTTVLAVVKNYGRLFPYISSIIMCIGLLIHLSMRLPALFRK